MGDTEQPGAEGRGLLGESLRKALLTGLSAMVITEEGIRSALGDLRLSKDTIASLVAAAERGRRELFNGVTDEVRNMVSSIDLTRELKRALTGLKLEVKAEVRFVDDDAGDTPTAPPSKVAARVRRGVRK